MRGVPYIVHTAYNFTGIITFWISYLRTDERADVSSQPLILYASTIFILNHTRVPCNNARSASLSDLSTMPSSNPSLVIVAGTYDGVLAGWETQDRGGRSLELTFATPIHQGSIRSLSLAAPSSPDKPGTILSCGYDEELKTHDWSKKLHSSGQVRTPADFGTPTCSAFAPPTTAPSTHCMLGFSGGKIVVYKKRDWSIQHVLEGHKGGVASVAVHPTGRIALTGGMIDGTLKL